MKKFVLLFMLFVVGFCLYAQNTQTEPYIEVDPVPAYPGGESEMYKFINERLFYPWTDDSIKGRVIIRFAVRESGDVADVKVIRGINPLADAIAVSIVGKMPRWIPGIQNGKPVPVYFILPITFDPRKIPAEKKLSIDCQMPSFSGGEEALYKFIAENMKYPYEAESVSDKLIIKFIVDKNGKVWHPFVVESLVPKIDAELLRVMRMMPDWVVPKGNIGCYLYTLPIIIDQ